MLSDREKHEIAEIVSGVLQPALRQLETEIAQGMALTIEEILNGLAGLIEGQNAAAIERLQRMRDEAKKSPAWLDKVLG